MDNFIDYVNFLLNFLLDSEENMSKLYKTLLFFYLTKMAVPWAIAYFILLGIACYEICNPILTYVVLIGGLIVGILISIAMISSMNRDASRVRQLRNLYFDFTDNIGHDLSKLSHPTIESLKNFQSVFAHITKPKRTGEPESIR
jgi:hypothetical protein